MIDARATFQGIDLGLAIDLAPGWEPCRVGDLPCCRGIVKYRSPGALGDRFLQVLSSLYGVSDAPTAMNRSVRFTAITLGDNPLDDSGPVHIKLFYEHDDEASYAELYTNIDMPRGIVQIREKDEAYRAAIVRALTKPPG